MVQDSPLNFGLQLWCTRSTSTIASFTLQSTKHHTRHGAAASPTFLTYGCSVHAYALNARAHADASLIGTILPVSSSATPQLTRTSCTSISIQALSSRATMPSSMRHGICNQRGLRLHSSSMTLVWNRIWTVSQSMTAPTGTQHRHPTPHGLHVHQILSIRNSNGSAHLLASMLPFPSEFPPDRSLLARVLPGLNLHRCPRKILLQKS